MKVFGDDRGGWGPSGSGRDALKAGAAAAVLCGAALSSRVLSAGSGWDGRLGRTGLRCGTGAAGGKGVEGGGRERTAGLGECQADGALHNWAVLESCNR